MKKQWIVLLAKCGLVCSMLIGCGSKLQIPVMAAAGNDKGCTDEAILSQLKNDGTPEFVLDGTYYTLPLETSQLMQAGYQNFRFRLWQLQEMIKAVQMRLFCLS